MPAEGVLVHRTESMIDVFACSRAVFSENHRIGARDEKLVSEWIHERCLLEKTENLKVSGRELFRRSDWSKVESEHVKVINNLTIASAVKTVHSDTGGDGLANIVVKYVTLFTSHWSNRYNEYKARKKTG